MRRWSSLIAATASLAMLSACASFSPDRGMAVVSQATQAAIGEDAVARRDAGATAEARDRMRALLRKPLAADDAVRVALLSNRALQAAYSELALAEADQVQESLPPNPTLSLSRIAGGGAVEIERQVVVDILALATLPARSSRKCAAVASGAVSVVPQDDDIGTRCPVVRTETASSRSQMSCGSAAPA